MVKDGEDRHGLQTTNLKSLGQTCQDAQTLRSSFQRTCNFTFYYGKGSALLNSCEQLEKTHWLLRQSREILTTYTDPLFFFAMRTNLFTRFAKKPGIDQNASVKVLKKQACSIIQILPSLGEWSEAILLCSSQTHRQLCR